LSSNKKNIKIIGIILGIVLVGVALTYVSANMFKTTLEQQKDANDPRTVFWQHVHGLGFEPTNREILYIATHGDFYQSVSGAPPVKVDERRADYMAFFAPLQEGYPLYSSGHGDAGENTGLIQSLDGGKTWEKVSDVNDSPVDFHAMAVSKIDPKIIIGFDSGTRNLFKTIDGGNTWDTLQSPGNISSLAISPKDSKFILAGTSQGIFKSENGGESWSQLKSYQKLGVLALAFDEEGRLFASVDTFGLVSSSDFGESWDDLENIGLTITSIAADSQNKVIYVSGFSADGYQEVYKLSYDLNSYDLIGTNKDLT
jgi:hypothetical protein